VLARPSSRSRPRRGPARTGLVRRARRPGRGSCAAPSDETLARIGPRVRLLAGRESPPFFAEIARRLGERVGARVETAPGGHAVYPQWTRGGLNSPSEATSRRRRRSTPRRRRSRAPQR
jgi:hypothetical protein